MPEDNNKLESENFVIKIKKMSSKLSLPQT